MNLVTEEGGKIESVTEDTVRETLATDAFGKFAILSASDGEFIQTGNNWQPGEACARFLKENDSDPWILEYREDGRQFRARGDRTLDEVIGAFVAYLHAKQEWRKQFWWIHLNTEPR